MAQKENAEPSGMLYFSLIEDVVRTNKNLSDEELAAKIREKFQMNGLILADVNIIKMMDKTLESLPVTLKQDRHN